MSSTIDKRLPPVWRAFGAFAISLALGIALARQAVVLLSPHVGTAAALPLGVLTLVMTAAVALVLAARLDARLSATSRR